MLLNTHTNPIMKIKLWDLSFLRYRRIWHFNILWGEAVLLFFWFLANAAIFTWQFFVILENEFGDRGDRLQVASKDLARAARAIGHLNNLNLGILLLPLARNSFWLRYLGVSFERAIRYHRWCARVLLFLITMHMACWWAFWLLNQDKTFSSISSAPALQYVFYQFIPNSLHPPPFNQINSTKVL